MNLDKTIKDLTNQLDSVHPASTNGGISHDGIHYWKSKQIISVKDWNELYEKNSTYTDNYKTTLTSKKPLQYFPDDYNGSTSLLSVIDQLKEEAQNWHTDYYELLEYRKNPTLGKMKCSKCLLSGSNDDPIFVGIEKVFGRIVSNQCNNDNTNAKSNGFISYHCNVMNIFSCPFESKEEYRNNNREEIKLPYTKENLFALHQISFAIEQAITTFFEITKQNEIIYEVDFVNDRVKEIHTKYNGEPERWGWNNNVKEILSKVKPILNLVIRNEQDIYSILTNREKLECLLEEYEKKYQLDRGEQQKVCCDENTPCVTNDIEEDNNSNNKKTLTANIIESLVEVTEEKKQQQLQHHVQDEQEYSHKGENPHSKNTDEQFNELNNEHVKPDLKAEIKEELEKSHREQLILLKENKQIIIDFLLSNKDSVKIEDLNIYEPIYKCYREKGNCYICNSLSNIICINCNNHNHNYNKEVWLCTNHW